MNLHIYVKACYPFNMDRDILIHIDNGWIAGECIQYLPRQYLLVVNGAYERTITKKRF